MPVKYVCRKCGFVLYEGREPVEVSAVRRKWGNRCPRCLRILSLKVEVSVVGGRDALAEATG